MNKVVIGTAQFGLNYGINNKIGRISQKKVNEIIKFCIKNKIYIFDTSQNYGDSETKIGNFFIKKKFKKLKIITKISSNNYKSLDTSVKKLRQVPYAVLFHNFKDYLKKSFRRKIFKECSKLGIKKIGVSVYHDDDINKVINSNNINIIQLPLNLIDRHFLENKTLDKLKRKKIEIHIRSIFIQGLLFMNKKKIKKDFPDLEKNLEIIDLIANQNKISINELCFRWAYSIKKVDKIVIGIDNLNQLKNNIKILKKKNKKIKFSNKINILKYKRIKSLDPRTWK